MQLFTTIVISVLLLFFGAGWQRVSSTCVFESDFGFTLNCAFKKSGLFRVRNLGGVKGYVGVGFSVGDELGFKEALSQVESNKRRSADSARSAPDITHVPEETQRLDEKGRSAEPRGRVGVLPAFKPLPPKFGSSNNHMNKMGVGTVEMVPAFAALPESIAKIPTAHVPNTPPRQPAQQAFQNALQMANRRFQVAVPNNMPMVNGAVIPVVAASINGLPPIQQNTIAQNALPADTMGSPPAVIHGLNIYDSNPLLMGHSIFSLSRASNISVETLAAAIKMRAENLKTSTTSTTSTTTTTTTTTTTSTPPPPPLFEKVTIRPKYSLNGANRVMNAPKEYYPVSYNKNYDDNFTSKVELPDTSFHCGDQKHFPGLYADEDLGCMVFHVCAFTDDGLVMKSFLCPESTLFDQTILKCNWWFYVDCKSSRKLYDSNIPISKSYQLMKALAFFSTYKNQTSNNT